MKIVFMGTSEFAVPALQALFDAHEVLAVVTQPDRPKGRGNKMAVSPVKDAALQRDVPILQPLRVKRKEAMAELAAFGADIFVVASYGQILSETILHMPKYGCINIHASILPKYRGASPIQQAILHGDAIAGVTIQQMDKGVDTGDILMIRETPITNDDTGGSLHDKLAALGAEAILAVLPMIADGTVTRVKQNDAEASHAPLLTKDMGRINWSQPPQAIVNLVRGLNPWPCAFMLYENQPIRILAATVQEGFSPALPGTICEASPKNGLVIAAADGLVRVVTVQAPNGKRMAAADYLRGHEMAVGAVLG